MTSVEKYGVNCFQQILSFCSYVNATTPAMAANLAINTFLQDQADGVNKYMTWGHGHGKKELAYQKHLRDNGFEVHLAASDEFFGFNDVWMDVYNTLVFAANRDLNLRYGVWSFNYCSEFSDGTPIC